jgi:8-oxo-dGTP pyrophosphatase MutT (NUDIX family)
MPNYNLRAYGLWINEEAEILVSHERMSGREFTKFPGGGLEKGEGAHDCLIREWKEELNLDIIILSHFYTTDFFQTSAFHDEFQLISIYYKVQPQKNYSADFLEKSKFSFQSDKEEFFEWIPIKEINEELFTFPIDKKVASLLQ